MPRPLLNISKSGYAIDENHKSSNKTLKLKKSITAANRKFNSTVKSQDRLVGGADVPEEKEISQPTGEILTEIKVEEDEKTSTGNDGEKTRNGRPIRSTGPCCTCLSQGSTGDKKVDEMIDYVHKNLQEAGKALANLSENFEHDSKVEPRTQVEPS
ncbi:PREDICTED: uncharacterized protein LOC108549690 [Eufriesea mexicana]|uniref:uncharacterized protein LOC108549690 n=1 Tax=Eufriesea mexicana TaxID=516756 RepID=UPI00083C0B07|nr:PREDICTED: uncharacterized protein LOC108549690 [Eufriesea mexicana]